MSKERVAYLDLLRVFSVFAMLMLHVAATNWYKTPVTSFEWQTFNAYDSLVRFCVPVFIMISGVFFLDPDREFVFKKVICKNILRIVTAFVFWSACYAVYVSVFVNNYRVINAAMLLDILKQFSIGHYHMWFLFTIVGLYLVAPFLREICKSKNLIIYYLILTFILNYTINLIEIIPVLRSLLEIYRSKANIYMILGYSGYFVLGYFLYKYNIGKRIKILAYLLGIVSVAFTIIGTSYLSISGGTPVETLYEYNLPNTCFASIAIFLFFKENALRIKGKGIYLLSRLSFGIYLVHDFINILFNRFLHFTTLSFNPVFSVPVITILVFAVSFCITWVISKIPFLNKYII